MSGLQCRHIVVLANARTHNHRKVFGEELLPPNTIERFRGMGPGFRPLALK